ncbi:MAG: hypothetical protein A2Y12_00455 [Planctomycetes bacterium GWF2_42_9]|nr:MAG: hypothetical protein A2Y12_00455 [Planctomycetes bacterium GWF2_42_9]
MYNNMIIKVLSLCLAISFMSSVVDAANKHSLDFQYKYEGDLFPSDIGTIPRWERGFSGGTDYETYYCSVGDGIFTIDTAKGPSATEGAYYSLPGEYSDFADEFYNFGEPQNPWNVNMAVGYTVEARFKVDAIQIPQDANFPDGKFAFWLYFQEGLHGQSNCIQVFPNKITAANSSTPNHLYTGDFTNKFYTLRVVRNPGAVEDIQNVYDLYLDNVLIVKGYASPANSSYNQDSFLFGDAAGLGGGTDIKVQIDYIRLDLTGAYAPAYLVTDINEDGFTNFADFAALAQNWLLGSDPEIEGFVDCINPANSEICQ